MSNKKTLNIHIFLLFLLLLASGFVGYFIGQGALPSPELESSVQQKQHSSVPPEETEPQIRQLLNISLSPDNSTHFSTYLPCDLTYLDVRDVTIDLDGQMLALEEAMQSGLITPEEIMAYARTDAENGFCYDTAISTNGLTKFMYHYFDKFDLCIYYDVYEAADGTQHLINNIIISEYSTAHHYSLSPHGTDKNGNRISLDREDWGLTFHVSEVDSQNLVLQITQCTGQQLGQLNVVQYSLISVAGGNALNNKAGSVFNNMLHNIQMEGDSTLILPLAEDYGALSPGEYTVWIAISDEYDEAQVHPLMKNFTDTQGYYIDFTVPTGS